jgi:23S rRNA pseudouridine955/2504/2580 synthase
VALDDDKQGEAAPEVVWRGDGLSVVDKPAGLAMHPGTGVEHEAETLLGWLRDREEIEAGFSGPSFLGRLDRPTSGLVIVALSREGLRSVERDWSGGLVEKAYLALVHGRTEEGGVIELPLAARRARHRGTGRVEEAITRFWGLSRPPKRAAKKRGPGDVSLALLFLETGRTHQIRRHMKAIGHPLVGDTRYGDRRRDEALGLVTKGEGACGLMLHCWRFRAPETEALPDVVTARFPARMRRVAEEAGIDVEASLARATDLGPPALDDEDEDGAEDDEG